MGRKEVISLSSTVAYKFCFRFSKTTGKKLSKNISSDIFGGGEQFWVTKFFEL